MQHIRNQLYIERWTEQMCYSNRTPLHNFVSIYCVALKIGGHWSIQKLKEIVGYHGGRWTGADTLTIYHISPFVKFNKESVDVVFLPM